MEMAASDLFIQHNKCALKNSSSTDMQTGEDNVKRSANAMFS